MNCLGCRYQNYVPIAKNEVGAEVQWLAPGAGWQTHKALQFDTHCEACEKLTELEAMGGTIEMRVYGTLV